MLVHYLQQACNYSSTVYEGPNPACKPLECWCWELAEKYPLHRQEERESGLYSDSVVQSVLGTNKPFISLYVVASQNSAAS